MQQPISSEPRLDQETFEIYAALASSLLSRLDEQKKFISGKTDRDNAPVAEDIEEAYQCGEVKADINALPNEIKTLAGKMVEAGMPLGVWVKLPKKEGEHRMKLRVILESTNPERYNIKIERA